MPPIITDRGRWPLARLVFLFVYLSHLGGCLFWYISVLDLEVGLEYCHR